MTKKDGTEFFEVNNVPASDVRLQRGKESRENFDLKCFTQKESRDFSGNYVFDVRWIVGFVVTMYFAGILIILVCGNYMGW